MRLVVLGSGTSFGVPVIGCACRVCTSTDPRDRRMRTAAVVENDEGARILIDTPPELRLQLVTNAIDRIDAVLYTHEHADHVHGIDDLRVLTVRRGKLPIHGPPETLRRIQERFGYIFDPDVKPAPGTSKPELHVQPLAPGEETTVAGMAVTPLEVDHGGMRVFGYRIGSAAYITDAKSIPQRSIELLAGVEVLILNALFDQPHPTHLSIDEAVQVAAEIGASVTYLTHLTHRYSHQELVDRLPAGVSPAFDGLVVSFDGVSRPR